MSKSKSAKKKPPVKKAAPRTRQAPRVRAGGSVQELLEDVQDTIEAIDLEEDMVNHPPHYGHHPSGVECITITEQFNFNVGNAIKYLWRHREKNGIEDLKKARWYVDREIERLESEGAATHD